MDTKQQITSFKSKGISHIPCRILLDNGQIEMIEEALSSLGNFGEVRLIVEKGKLRFLVMQKSVDVFKWQPGHISNGRD